MDYRLETEEERHPLESVRVGLRAALAHFAKEAEQRRRREEGERRAQRRDSG